MKAGYFMDELYQLRIEPDFRRLVAPLTLTELKSMEDSLNNPDSAKEVRVWKNTILVDYEYYDYCHMLQIPFLLINVPLANREEATAWICENQLHRKCLTEEMKKYLIGKRSVTETALGAHEYATLKQRTTRRAYAIMKLAKYDSSATQTRERLGTEYFLSFGTIRKYEQYCLELDRILEIFPNFVEEHLAGRLKVSHERLDSLALLPPSQIEAECAEIITGNQQPKTSTKGQFPRYSDMEKAEKAPSASIKDMPVYDPDAEISSLTLTIPSWISTINRVRNATTISETSESAMLRLKEALLNLIGTADMMLSVLREDHNG